MRHRYIGYAGWVVSGVLAAVVDVAWWQWAIIIMPIAAALGIKEALDGQ